MRDCPRHFYRKAKCIGTVVIKSFQHLNAGKPVECDVQFHCIEMFAIIFEPILCGKVIRIKNISPMLVMKPGGMDADRDPGQVLA